MMKRTFLTSALAFGAALASPMAQAQEWPTRPLTMVIGFAPGGSTDIQGRVLANVMEEFFGQPVNVVNQPGAGSAVAFTRLKNNRDEGYTFLFGGTTALTFTPIITEVEYEIDDFQYLAAVAIGQNALVTSSQQPYANWEELVAHATANPVTYAQQTALDQSIMERVAEEAGIDVAIIPTGGGGGMAPLVLGREVDFAYSGGTHAQYTPSGEMNVLAFLSRERSPFYPEVPTLRELGFEYAIEDYRAIIVPANTPANVTARLIEAAEYASQSETFRAITEDNTFFPVIFIGQEEMEANVRRIRAETEEVMGGED